MSDIQSCAIDETNNYVPPESRWLTNACNNSSSLQIRLLRTLSRSAGIIINSLGVPARLVDGDRNGLRAGLNADNAYWIKTKERDNAEMKWNESLLVQVDFEIFDYSVCRVRL